MRERQIIGALHFREPRDDAAEFGGLEALGAEIEPLGRRRGRGHELDRVIVERIDQKYKALGLKDKKLEEKDYRKYILDEYTFLKRPVVIINNKIFVGSEKKMVAALREAVK